MLALLKNVMLVIISVVASQHKNKHQNYILMNIKMLHISIKYKRNLKVIWRQDGKKIYLSDLLDLTKKNHTGIH